MNFLFYPKWVASRWRGFSWRITVPKLYLERTILTPVWKDMNCDGPETNICWHALFISHNSCVKCLLCSSLTIKKTQVLWDAVNLSSKRCKEIRILPSAVHWMCGVQHALPKSFLAGFAFLQVRDVLSDCSEPGRANACFHSKRVDDHGFSPDGYWIQPYMIKTILGFCS